MAYWIFKLASQELYADVPGQRYSYDNTHSVRVRAGDVFLYLDKRNGYAFSATGTIRKVDARKLHENEARRDDRIHTIFAALLSDVIWFSKPFSIASQTKAGRANRAKLGVLDVNLIGWSTSIPMLSETMYDAIMALVEADGLISESPVRDSDYFIDDKWGKCKVRKALSPFCSEVLDRHSRTCVVCGTTLEVVLDVAHLSPFAVDKNNRANPSNGVCVCAFCHRVLDRRLIAICPDGNLLVSESIVDPIALEHFARVTVSQRRAWLAGVSSEFLELTVKWFDDNRVPKA